MCVIPLLGHNTSTSFSEGKAKFCHFIYFSTHWKETKLKFVIYVQETFLIYLAEWSSSNLFFLICIDILGDWSAYLCTWRDVTSGLKKGWHSLMPLNLRGKAAAQFSLFLKVRSAGQTKGSSPVYLNVYDLTPMNGYFYWAGIGIYHSGVEGTFFPSSIRINHDLHNPSLYFLKTVYIYMLC